MNGLEREIFPVLAYQELASDCELWNSLEGIDVGCPKNSVADRGLFQRTVYSHWASEVIIVS